MGLITKPNYYRHALGCSLLRIGKGTCVRGNEDVVQIDKDEQQTLDHLLEGCGYFAHAN